MQYFERAFGTVSRTWNSINPATLSGAIDVVVIKVSTGELHCSAFHIRFGKLSLLQPSQKGVDFYVNGKKMDHKMKLGEGGEAFFVFETDADVPESMLTSPVSSPQSSPRKDSNNNDDDVDFLDISQNQDNQDTQDTQDEEAGKGQCSNCDTKSKPDTIESKTYEANNSDAGDYNKPEDNSIDQDKDKKGENSEKGEIDTNNRNEETKEGRKEKESDEIEGKEENVGDRLSKEDLKEIREEEKHKGKKMMPTAPVSEPDLLPDGMEIDNYEPMLRYEHPERIDKIIKKLRDVKFPKHQGNNGKVIMDMSGYKSSGDDAREIEKVVNRYMHSDESPGESSVPTSPNRTADYDDDYNESDDSGDEHYQTPEPQLPTNGYNFSSIEPRRLSQGAVRTRTSSNGHRSNSRRERKASKHSIDFKADKTDIANEKSNEESKDKADKADKDQQNPSDAKEEAKDEESKENETPPRTPEMPPQNRKFVKTLRLSSDILKTLGLHPGENEMKFVVRSNGACTCASIHLWDSEVPVVISDIDGTITKSDAMGHLMAFVGIDWTHAGVGRLFSDINANGYNILYLTSRSVGLADTTRSYLRSIEQSGYRLPPGPVILSPDRTIAALRREVILRKPEVFKMACLRDIAKLYEQDFESPSTPFYAGFGNRITDAISYRSVGVPPTKIFTINTESEVRMELLEFTGVKSSYIMITDLVDQLFPPVHKEMNKKFDLNSQEFSDTNYWKYPVIVLSDDELSDAELIRANRTQFNESAFQEEDEENESELETETDAETDRHSFWDSELSDSDMNGLSDESDGSDELSDLNESDSEGADAPSAVPELAGPSTEPATNANTTTATTTATSTDTATTTNPAADKPSTPSSSATTNTETDTK